SPAFAVQLRVTLGYTAAQPDALSPQLAANFAATPPPLLVFAGAATFAPTVGAADGSFELVVPLQTPFVLDARLGNVLLQLDVLGNDHGRPLPVGLDAVAVATGTSLGA